MSLVLDPEVVESVKPTPSGTDVPLTKEQKEVAVFHKYVSTDHSLSDIEPADPWIEQIIADVPIGAKARPRIAMGSGKDTRSVSETDGLIIDLVGHPTGTFGYIEGVLRPEEDVEQWEQDNEKEVTRLVRWSFYVTRIRHTNGPELREKAFRTQLERQDQEKAELFETLTQLFKGAQQAALKAGDVSSDIQKAIDRAKRG